MYQRIGVPLDGSAWAEQALPVAARLARASDAVVVLLHVVDPRTDLLPYYPSDLGVVQAMIHDEQIAARHYLEGLAYLHPLAEVRTEITVLCGQPAARILSEVDAGRIALLVMCIRSCSDLARRPVAGLAKQIARGAPAGTLLVKLADLGIDVGMAPCAE